MSRSYNFGGLVNLSQQMQAALPGSLIENGYAISGPNEAGYYQIIGPDLTSPAYVSGDVPFYHPVTGQLIYKPYIPPLQKEKPRKGFPFLGWVFLLAILYITVG